MTDASFPAAARSFPAIAVASSARSKSEPRRESATLEAKVRLSRPEADVSGVGAPESGVDGGASMFGFRLDDDEREYLTAALGDLTDREREVVFAICEGGTNEEVARRLCIALPTLRTHLMRLNQKLGTASKTDVVGAVAARLLRGYRTGALTGALT